MRLNKAWIVATKDIEEFKKNRFVLWSLVGMPIIIALVPMFSLITPFLITQESISSSEMLELTTLLSAFTLPLLIMIPAITPSIIASYSFVGEKVNRSLEPLLATPTTDLELLIGKGMAAFIPTMIGTYVAFIIDIVAIDLVTYPLLGFLLVPDLTWILGMLLLAPGFCILSIETNVLVSSRMTDVRAAQQVGGLIVIPLLAIYFGSLTNFFPLNTINMLVLTAIVLASAGILGCFTRRIFDREEILTKWR